MRNEATTATEVWRAVPGHDGAYEVSSLGRVRSLDRMLPGRDGSLRPWPGRILKPRVYNGYSNVKLGRGKWISVHRLVLSVFSSLPPFDGAECRHLNGDRSDNRAENLAWGSSAQNKLDMALHGTDPRGERNGRAKLTETDVVDIFKAHAGGERIFLLARRFGVTSTSIRRVLLRERWGWVAVPQSVLDRSRRHFAPSR